MVLRTRTARPEDTSPTSAKLVQPPLGRGWYWVIDATKEGESHHAGIVCPTGAYGIVDAWLFRGSHQIRVHIGQFSIEDARAEIIKASQRWRKKNKLRTRKRKAR